MDSSVCTAGAPVWVQDAESGWTSAEVVALDGNMVVVQTEEGRKLLCEQQKCFLQNTDSENVEDMTTLAHLHEPGVLYNLRHRFQSNDIYTYTGSILIAVNPFAPIPHLFGLQIMEQYRAAAAARNTLPPHVYAVACAAYNQMMRDQAGQAILITGESGAGKTETSKLIMKCLACLGGDSSRGVGGAGNPGVAHDSPGVEQKVLESNPLLEAFGNAKTVRNDNSSRFGKYVEISFTPQGAIRRAAIRTYLLERSRVVHLNSPERSFHVFYQLCAGASKEERERLHLQPANHFNFLNQSTCFQLPGVSDAHEYQATRKAMTCVGISSKEQDMVFQLVAAILHLGNVQFSEPTDRHDASVVSDATSLQHLQHAADLLGVDSSQLQLVLTTRTRQTLEGPIVSPLSTSGAEENRNSLAKVIYSRLFNWLVARINSSMRADQDTVEDTNQHPITNGHAATDGSAYTNGNGLHYTNGHASTNGTETSSTSDSGDEAGYEPSSSGRAGAGSFTIGLLDIYGFESFAINDLEQLCINLANEKLQQHFNQHVFKWEQAEYKKEGIDWRYIEFVDNQDVLDLIEGRLGLFDLLDEQCRFPTATAEDLSVKYTSASAVKNSKRFTRLKRPASAFAIDHYAGQVAYCTDNFLDKNKDYVVAEHAALLQAAGMPLVQRLFTDEEEEVAAADGAQVNGQANSKTSSAFKSFKFNSVATQFKKQLSELMAKLHAMQPHYVRCIKPNPQAQPGVFDNSYVLQQLQCGGVMQAVQISCAGFPYKRPYEAFVDYFWPLEPAALHSCLALGPEGQAPEAKQQVALQLLEAAGVEDYQLGYTKLFLRAGQAAYLDKLRTQTLNYAATVIQSQYRGFAARQYFMVVQWAVREIQACARGMLARRLVYRLRHEKAALTIQSLWRARTARANFLKMRAVALVLQRVWRLHAARQQLEALQREHAALVLQSLWRMRTARLPFLHHLRRFHAACTIQASWRGHAVRAQFWDQLRRNHAAAIIQRVWRGSRDGTRLRNRLRAALQEYMQLHRACVHVQCAWRAKAARKLLHKLQHADRTRKFMANFNMFEQQQQPGASVPARRAGSGGSGGSSFKALGGITCSSPYGFLGSTDVYKRTLSDKRRPGLFTAPSSATPADIVRSDVVRVDDKDGLLKTRLGELGDFKLSPLLQFWQSRLQATPSQAGPGSAGPSSPATSPSASNRSSRSGQGRYGTLLSGDLMVVDGQPSL